MHYLPSTLEYYPDKLKEKLQLVKNNLNLFLATQNPTYQNSLPSNTQPLYFHVDCVLPQFAKDAKVMTGLNLESNFSILSQYFSQKKLQLSIHLMGTLEDILEIQKFLQSYQFNPNWHYTFYLPDNLSNLLLNLKNHNVELGIWLDLGNWSETKIVETSKFVDKILLMTVKAGKSGQKLESSTSEKALELAQKFPEQNFIVDGGWSLNQPKWVEKLYNLQIASYSSFWNVFKQ